MKSSFRKRSFSADGTLPKLRTPQVRRLQPNRPSSAGVILDDSPNRPSAFYKPTTPGPKRYELPTSPLLHDAPLHKSGDLCSFDAAFKAVTTDKGQRELLEKTLKEFIKIKYHQSVSGRECRTTPPPNPKISPMTTDFLKLLSLQARIMGVPLPPGLDSVSKTQLISPKTKTPDKRDDASASFSERSLSGTHKSVTVDSYSKDSSISGALGITKHKKLSFAGSDKYRVEQGQFAKVMHDKLVKQFVSEESDMHKKSTKSTSPTHTEKRSAKSDKRKQVLKKQHALRVAKELKKDIVVGDAGKVTNELPSVSQVDIKDEKMDDGYDLKENSSVLSDFNENCLIKGAADISEMDIKCEVENGDKDMSICFDVKERYGTINDGNNSIHLPSSAYVFKPIVISPAGERVKGKKHTDTDIFDEDSHCSDGDIQSVSHHCVLDLENEEESNQSNLSCTCDISTAEHSFVPRDSLSSLQVEDEVDSTQDSENTDEVWKILPFADVDSLPDMLQPLQGIDIPLRKKSPIPVQKQKHKSSEKASVQVMSEDSNMSNISMESVGFDIQTAYSPNKVCGGSHEESKVQTSEKTRCDGHKETGHSGLLTEEIQRLPKTTEPVPSQGFSVITKTSLDDLAVSLSNFSPVKPDATSAKGFMGEQSQDPGESPIQKDTCGNNTESGMAQTSTPKITKHAKTKGFDDHNYTYQSRQARGKVTKDFIRKRKPQKTKKFFPLISYLTEEKAVGNIETEVVNMDDVSVITLTDEPRDPVIKTSKKRQMSGNSKTSLSTPSKRIRREEDMNKVNKPKPVTNRSTGISAGKLCKKPVAKPTTVTVVSSKKPPVRPPFRTVSNETILKQNKKTDLLVHQPAGQKSQFGKPLTTPKKSTVVKGAVASGKKALKSYEKDKVVPSVDNKLKLKKVDDECTVVEQTMQSANFKENVVGNENIKTGFEIDLKVRKNVTEVTVMDAQSSLSSGDLCWEGEHVKTVDIHSGSSGTDCTDNFHKSEIKSPDEKVGITPTLSISPSVIVSLPIEQIFNCNKLNLVVGDILKKPAIPQQALLSESPPKPEVNVTACDGQHTESGELIQVSGNKRPKSLSPHRKYEHDPKANLSNEKERPKSVSPFYVSEHIKPKFSLDKCRSAEDLSSLKDIYSSCTDGVSHLLVRPVPTQYSSPRVGKSKALKAKLKEKKVNPEVVQSSENTTVPLGATNVISAVSHILPRTEQETLTSTAVTETPPCLKKRHKPKHSSNKKRRKKSLNDGISSQSKDSPKSCVSEIKCLQASSNINQGKGRAGKKRAEDTEGFKMKKHWLEMYGPVSPRVLTGVSSSAVIPDNKENY